MAFDQDACDLYQIITGVLQAAILGEVQCYWLQEDAGKELEDMEVYEVTRCEGGCNDSRHTFEIKTAETTYTVVLAVKEYVKA